MVPKTQERQGDNENLYWDCDREAVEGNPTTFK